MISRVATLAIVLVAVLAAAIYVPTLSAPTTTSSTTNTTSTSCTTSTSTSTTTSTSTSTSASVTSENGTFTYSPSSPVKVDSVQATKTFAQDGRTLVTFEVAFENIGDSNIYVLGGCGGGLSASVVGNSTLQKVNGGPLCDCAEFILTLSQGQNHTSVTPGCWSGYDFQLVSPGTVQVNLTLQWSSDSNDFSMPNSTSISAQFTFNQ